MSGLVVFNWFIFLFTSYIFTFFFLAGYWWRSSFFYLSSTGWDNCLYRSELLLGGLRTLIWKEVWTELRPSRSLSLGSLSSRQEENEKEYLRFIFWYSVLVAHKPSFFDFSQLLSIFALLRFFTRVRSTNLLTSQFDVSVELL